MKRIISIIKDFRFKSWHFVILFLVLFVLTNILGAVILDNAPKTNGTGLTELNGITIDDAISSNVSFILFYKQDSDVCQKMEYNLCQLLEKKQDNVKYYKIDIEKYPEKYIHYNISGTPSISIYKEGKEIERIMGFIPKSNLEIIHNRVTK